MQKKVFAKFNALLDWQRTKESNPGILNEKNKWDNVRSGINKVEKRRKKNASMTNCWEAKVNQLLEKLTRKKKIEQNNAINKI